MLLFRALSQPRHQGIPLLRRLGKEQDGKSRPPWCSAGKHPFLVGPSDIAEVRLEEVMTNKPLKFSGVFTLVAGQYLRYRYAGKLLRDTNRNLGQENHKLQ